MADEKNNQPQNPEPPKIKLNGNGKHHTNKIPPIPAPPPKVKFETTRIKLETAQIHIPTPPSEDAPTKQSTMRINLPGSEIAETEPTVAPSSKQTSRIGIPGAFTPAPATAKKTTARIELPGTMPAATPGGAKKAANRVQLPDTVSAQPPPSPVKKQTTRIDVDAATVIAAGAQVAKKTTARIELGDAIGTARGTDIGVASAHQIPRTVRIKQPDSRPTVAARRVPEIIDTLDARKSETARIELPPETIVEQPVTRRKTIRIKRPGAEGDIPTSTRAPITVARTAPGVAGKPAAESEVEAEITVSEAAGEEASLVATLCAVAALIIASVLVYVLAAQTIAPHLPFPGKV